MQLGNSSQYVYLASIVGKGILSPESYDAYFLGVASKSSSWSQAIQSIGCITGAFVSVQLSHTRIDQSASHAGPIQCFLGGIVLMCGARMAGGCPSGHGLSGMAKLGIGSFMTVAFMFIGGGATALFL